MTEGMAGPCAQTGVPGVRSEAAAEAVRAALGAVPLARGDRPWVAAALVVAAAGGAWSTTAEADLGPGGFAPLAVAFVLAMLTGAPLGRSRRLVTGPLRLVCLLLFLPSVGLLGAAFGWFARTSQVSTGVILAVAAACVVSAVVHLVQAARERSVVPPVWPRGAEVVAVLAVLATVTKNGIHPTRLARLTGLEPRRAEEALDEIGREGLLQGSAKEPASAGRAVLVNLRGRDRLAAWRQELGLTPVALLRRAHRSTAR